MRSPFSNGMERNGKYQSTLNTVLFHKIFLIMFLKPLLIYVYLYIYLCVCICTNDCIALPNPVYVSV